MVMLVRMRLTLAAMPFGRVCSMPRVSALVLGRPAPWVVLCSCESNMKAGFTTGVNVGNSVGKNSLFTWLRMLRWVSSWVRGAVVVVVVLSDWVMLVMSLLYIWLRRCWDVGVPASDACICGVI